ncbi:MAG: methenyltetrahydromethanopterin cyclohydrolase [Thermoprotei archaeon]|nr:MAG: methenyltetrahydromethanopterin cyclohydrolase [Thermoprotei archaeon]
MLVPTNVSVNKRSLKILDKMLSEADVLGIKYFKSKIGATIVDCGVEAKAGYAAGLYVAEICLGGLASVSIRLREYDGVTLPVVEEFTDHPVIACMASQYAGWSIRGDGFSALGSGPARALAKKPKKLFEEIGYEDQSDETVIVLEASRFPPESVLKDIADKCGVSPQNLYVIVVPTSSPAGAVQISARIVETGIHRLHVLGFKLDRILQGLGVCPIAPLHPDSTIMMGRTNDALIYAGEVTLTVRHEDDKKLEKLINEAPSCRSSSYGKPFYEIFKEAGFDFYKVDPRIFAPSSLTIFNVMSGKIHRAGRVNIDVLRSSWGLAIT